MNTYDTFQKLTKRSSAKGYSVGGDCIVQYEEGGYKSKDKKCYSEERRAKRDWRGEE